MRTNAIKTARKRAGLSQVQLAQKLGVSPSTVAAWELGTHSMRTARLQQVARALGVKVSKLLA